MRVLFALVKFKVTITLVTGWFCEGQNGGLEVEPAGGEDQGPPELQQRDGHAVCDGEAGTRLGGLAGLFQSQDYNTTKENKGFIILFVILSINQFSNC